jgi:hypothetical protein
VAYISRTGAIGNGTNGFKTKTIINLASEVVISVSLAAQGDNIYVTFIDTNTSVLSVKTIDYGFNIISQYNISAANYYNAHAAIYQDKLYILANKSVASTVTAQPFVFDLINHTLLVYLSTGFITTPCTAMSKPFFANGFLHGIFFFANRVDSLSPTSTTLQNTFFVLRMDSSWPLEKVVGRLLYGQAGSFLTDTFSAQQVVFNSLTVDNYHAYLPIIDRISGIGARLVSGITRASLNFAPNFVTSEKDDCLFLSGNFVQKYDSQSVSEADFLIYPPMISSDVTANATGGASAGVYSIAVTFEWIDASGRKTISRPWFYPYPGKTMTAGQKFTYTLPGFSLTAKGGVKICVYRTQANQSVYRKCVEVLAKTTSQVMDDILTDSSLILNELLYTSGNVLNSLSVGGDVLRVAKNRLWCASEDTIYYSKQSDDSLASSFAGELAVKLPFNYNITDVQELDDKVIIFTTNQIFVIQGNPPANNGQGSSLSEPFKLSSDIGCISSLSTVIFPEGIIFQSEKGIYLLGRDMNISYIGAMVQTYNDLVVRSSLTMPDRSLVLLFTDTTTLVYNYLFGQWTTFTNLPCIRACSWQGKLVILKTDSEMFLQSYKFSDNNQHIPMVLETSCFPSQG